MVSTATPLCSHLVGLFPVWFCIKTLSSTYNGSRGRACFLRFSVDRKYRSFKDCSLRFRASFQKWTICGLLQVDISLEIPERLSRRRQPKTTSVGDSLQVGSGVLRSISRARTILSVSRVPFADMLFITDHFELLAATSARPLDNDE